MYSLEPTTRAVGLNFTILNIAVLGQFCVKGLNTKCSCRSVIKEISNNDLNNFSGDFCRHSLKTWKHFSSFKFHSLPSFATNDRKHFRHPNKKTNLVRPLLILKIHLIQRHILDFQKDIKINSMWVKSVLVLATH